MRPKHADIAVRTSLVYALVAGLWILLSDRALIHIVTDPSLLGRLEIAKGWAYVLVTAILLYVALERQLRGRRKEAGTLKAAVRHSEDRFRTAFEHAAIGIEQVGLDGRIQEVNDHLCEMLGYAREEFLALTVDQIIYAEDLPRCQEQTRQLLDGAIPQMRLEERLRRKDGSPVWVRVTSALTRGEKPYRITVVEDISERKTSQERVDRQNAILAAINRIFHDALICDTEESLGRTCLDVAERITESRLRVRRAGSPTLGVDGCHRHERRGIGGVTGPGSIRARSTQAGSRSMESMAGSSKTTGASSRTIRLPSGQRRPADGSPAHSRVHRRTPGPRGQGPGDAGPGQPRGRVPTVGPGNAGDPGACHGGSASARADGAGAPTQGHPASGRERDHVGHHLRQGPRQPVAVREPGPAPSHGTHLGRDHGQERSGVASRPCEKRRR